MGVMGMNKDYRPGKGVYFYLFVLAFSIISTFIEGKFEAKLILGYVFTTCLVFIGSYSMWCKKYGPNREEIERVSNEIAQKRQEKHELATTIVRTTIIDDSASSYKTKKSTTSAVGRAVVGGAIAGPVGSIVGASTAKGSVQEIKGKKVRFLIEYANGKKKTEDVKIDSRRYKELIQYM